MPVQAEQVLFEEDQSFRQPWLWALLASIFLFLVVIFSIVIFKAPNQAGFVQAVVGIGVGIVIQLGVAVLMYTLKLSVRVDSESLYVRFWPLVKKDIRLNEIASWEARTYRPIREYDGWGIRCGWKGMAYNVSGNWGVQLEFTNGKRLLIGSQRPEELAAAISHAKQVG